MQHELVALYATHAHHRRSEPHVRRMPRAKLAPFHACCAPCALPQVRAVALMQHSTACARMHTEGQMQCDANRGTDSH
eukprot:3778680-Rhodomonas_salina.2